MSHLTISHTTRHYPTLPYEDICAAVHSPDYSLSLVFVGRTLAQRINSEARGKTYVPDVLSFPLDETHGEIYLCLPVAYQKAPQYDHTLNGHVGFLFIHGLLHLKGFTHGATMEAAERKLCARFNLR